MILQQQIEHIVEQVNEMKDADFFQVREKVRYLNSVPTNSLNPNELVEILTYFQNFVIHLPMSIFPDEPLTFVRGRVSEDGKNFSNIREISYRSASNIGKGVGRAHSNGNTMFYASNYPEVVFSELGLKKGDIVNLLLGYAKGPLSLAVIGDLDNYRRTGRTIFSNAKYDSMYKQILSSLRPEARTAVLLTDAFLHDRFSRHGALEYDVSNAITSMLFNIGPQSIDGIIYRSLAHPGGSNFAIQPQCIDKHIEFRQVLSMEIVEVWDYGIYWAHESMSHSIDGNGVIEWREQPGAMYFGSDY